MTRPQNLRAKLEEKIEHNDKFTYFRFSIQDGKTLDFSAGQYVIFFVDEKRTNRAYSIASNPASNTSFEIIVDITPQGLGVKYLSNLQLGDMANILAPMGKFGITPENNEDSLVFICTGSGIAPLRSMIWDQLENKKDTRPIHLLWGLRFRNQVILDEHFQYLQKTFPNFHYHLALSREEASPTEYKRVTDCLTALDLKSTTGYYLCGSGDMVEDAVRLITESKGATQNNIHFEKYG